MKCHNISCYFSVCYAILFNSSSPNSFVLLILAQMQKSCTTISPNHSACTHLYMNQFLILHNYHTVRVIRNTTMHCLLHYFDSNVFTFDFPFQIPLYHQIQLYIFILKYFPTYLHTFYRTCNSLVVRHHFLSLSNPLFVSLSLGLVFARSVHVGIFLSVKIHLLLLIIQVISIIYMNNKFTNSTVATI